MDPLSGKIRAAKYANSPTFRALEAMSRALPSNEWMVRIIDAETSKVEVDAVYSRYQFIHATAFYRYMSWNECHVYGRPMSTRFLLVDDLDQDKIDEMDRADMAPSVVVMTSKANYQAYVTVAATEVEASLAANAARLLARDFGGDPGSAKALQFGRLPGTTNCKDIYGSRGNFPFARLVRARSQPAKAGSTLLERASRELVSASVPSTLGVCAPANRNIQTALPRNELVAMYSESYEAVLRYYPALALDRSRIDFAIARDLKRHGFPQQDIVDVLMAASLKARERGDADRALQYVQTTVLAACR